MQILETRHGREAGWLVEHHGRCVAVLAAPRRVDMFIDSYRVEPLNDDMSGGRAVDFSPQFWRTADITFRSQRFGDVAPHAVVLSDPDPAEGRVLMRGLYLPIGDPALWESLLVRWRAFRRRGR